MVGRAVCRRYDVERRLLVYPGTRDSEVKDAGWRCLMGWFDGRGLATLPLLDRLGQTSIRRCQTLLSRISAGQAV